MPRPPRSTGRYPRRSVPRDDEDATPRANPAAIVAVLAVVLGGGLLLWVMFGGPTVRSAPSPAAKPAPAAGGPIAVAQGNRPPRVELRMRIDPRQPYRMEYGAFSDDPDPHDEGKLTHAWTFGDGTPGSTSERGLHVFRQAGTFTVTVVVRDAAGASAEAQQTVTMEKPELTVRTQARQGEIPGLRVRRIDLPSQLTFKALNDRWADGERISAQTITNSIRQRDTWYALGFTGAIIIPRAGIWTFSLTSDDGSRLILDGKKVINIDQYQAATTEYAVVQADAGLLPFQLDYYQGDGDQELRLQWAGPEQDWQDIPPEAFVHRPE